MGTALAILTVCAACATCFLAGLRVNLNKTIAMCDRCKHFQAKCAECMAARATYE